MKKKLKFIIFLVSLFLLFLCSLLIVSIFMRYSSKDSRYYNRGISIIPESDYILVPGARIYFNQPSTYLEHRLNYAYMLYEEGKSKKVIVSGAFDESVGKYEPEIMEDYLINLGVEPEDIIVDLNGRNTFETIKRTKEFVGDKSVIFCTQELYSHRAMYIANSLDLNMVVFCSDPIIYSKRGKNSIRELLAQCKAILNCTFFTPETKTLTDSPFFYGKEEL